MKLQRGMSDGTPFFGAQVEQARRFRGLTKSEAAARARMSAKRWSAIERGASFPSRAEVDAMGLALGFPGARFSWPPEPSRGRVFICGSRGCEVVEPPKEPAPLRAVEDQPK